MTNKGNILKNKIDFKGFILVKNANPNGDPLNGNMPRTIDGGYGEISDVCLKRKIRNFWMDSKKNVFVQSDDNKVDECKSLKERADKDVKLKKAGKDKNRDEFVKIACENWIDVRSFGQVFAFNGGDDGNISMGIRGPVSIHPAFSIEPINTTSIQITKSVNNVSNTSGKKDSDTMGMKHRVDFGIYELKGSINVQLAEKTGFTEDDAEALKEAIKNIFLNDASSARPEGSMQMLKLYWFKHDNKIGKYSTVKVHDSIEIVKEKKDKLDIKLVDGYYIHEEKLEGLQAEIYDGI